MKVHNQSLARGLDSSSSFDSIIFDNENALMPLNKSHSFSSIFDNPKPSNDLLSSISPRHHGIYYFPELDNRNRVVQQNEGELSTNQQIQNACNIEKDDCVYDSRWIFKKEEVLCIIFY